MAKVNIPANREVAEEILSAAADFGLGTWAWDNRDGMCTTSSTLTATWCAKKKEVEVYSSYFYQETLEDWFEEWL